MHRVLRIFPALIVVVLVSMFLLGPSLTTLPLTSYFSDPHLYLYGKNALTLSIRYLPGVVRDGGPIIINGSLWTLNFEVWCYVALALLSLLRLLPKRGFFLMLFAASYTIYVIINLDPAAATVFSGRFTAFEGLFVYFAAGSTLYLFRDRVPFSTALAFCALAVVIIALPYGLGAVVTPLCLPYIVIVFGLSSLPGQSLVKRDLSYGVYLTHAPILVAFSLLFPGLRIWWVGAAAAFMIALLLSYLSWTFIEEPILRQKNSVSNWIDCRLRLLRNPSDKRDRAQAVTSK